MYEMFGVKMAAASIAKGRAINMAEMRDIMT